MDRRRAISSGLVAVLLVVAFAAQATLAVDKALCESARSSLPNNPTILALKSCVAQKPITIDCCRKLLDFQQYYDCLSDPSYKAEVNKYLAGTTTVDQVQTECLKFTGGKDPRGRRALV